MAVPLLVTLDHFLTCGPSAWPIRCLSAEPNICHQKRSGEGVERASLWSVVQGGRAFHPVARKPSCLCLSDKTWRLLKLRSSSVLVRFPGVHLKNEENRFVLVKEECELTGMNDFRL